MPRPSLLQAIFQQPSQPSPPSPHVMKEPTHAVAVPPRKGWRSSLPFRRSTPSAHYVDDGSDGVQPRSPITGTAKTGAGTGPSISTSKTNDRRGRAVSRPSIVAMKSDIVVPTLAFIASPSPVSSVSTSPSPTPPLISPASTPKSNSPSFTDETSDSSVEPEFITPPSSPKPTAHDVLVKHAANVSETLPAPTDSDSRSLFSSHSSDTETASRRSSPMSSPPSTQSKQSTQQTRTHGVRQTPLSGVPDWAKDVRWLVGPQPAAKRAALTALADPNFTPVRQVRSATAPSRSSLPVASSSRSGSGSGKHSGVNQFGYQGPSRPPSSRRSNSRRVRAVTEGRRSGSRMSALVEVSEGEEAGEMGTIGSDGVARKRSTSQQRARPRPHSIRSSSSASSSRTVLPTPLPASASEPVVGAGYVSLAHPRAVYTPSKTLDRPTSVLDLSKSGLAQPTMSTISIIRGAGRGRRMSMSLSLNSSRTSLRSLGGLSSRNPSITSLVPGPGPSVPLALRLEDLKGALGLTSHMAPPRKVQNSHVIVQIHAVALDALDALIVSERMGKGGSEGAGFVPGRSFVGRAVECGFEVSNVSRGDWVIGLADIRRCGALAEFITIDKRRVCSIPRPTELLTTTQYALLPLCGIPAHRAVRTIPSGARRGMRALVLQAHDGAGALAVQTMRGLGMKVTAQVPVGVRPEGMLGQDVEIVVGDDPVEVIGRLEEGVFDAVVDTVGGRSVWDACRRVMCSDAHFTTLVGDSSDTVPSMNAHVRSSFRSLARAFAKKDKALAYQWVSPAADLDHEGEDVKHSLGAVAQLAASAAYGGAQSGMIPRVACSFPFEKAPDAFTIDEHGRGPLVRGGTVVVRVL
ncbi:hypothetical protein BDV93DRAFT_519891 [Ceratobasidium sp. AG-I]|nr:hypothetical protein BDV93DRAFT_519891 [Ceratobasidium sp. AG-I]